MTPTEKRIALFIKDHYDENEDCLEMMFYRLYTDSDLFNGALKDCGYPDVLSFECVERQDGRQYVQLFVSTPDDDGQDWFTFSELSRRDRLNVVRLFEEMTARSGFTQRMPAIAL